MKKFEDILIQCIDDIKAGRSSMEDCLDRYPSMREQLEPLLRIALAIQESPDVRPSPGFKIRARHQIMEQIHERQAVTKWPWLRHINQMKLTPLSMRSSVVRISLAIVLTFFALGSTAYAAQDSLPGDALYMVKLATERVLDGLPTDEADRSERALNFAERRVQEMMSLAENGRPQDLDLAVEKYDYALNITMTRIEEAGDNELPTGNITALVAEATARHLLILDEVWDIVPDEAKAAITHARNVSETGRENALAALAKNNPVRAVELNLAAMEGRLNRVRARVGDVEEVENALQQFEAMAEFGEEILAIAQQIDTGEADVATLVAESTSGQLIVLGEVYELVSEEAKAAITEAMEFLVIGHKRAVEVLEALGEEVPALDIPEGMPDSVRDRLEEILEGVPPGADVPDGVPIP